jgi:hypothetical protein
VALPLRRAANGTLRRLSAFASGSRRQVVPAAISNIRKAGRLRSTARDQSDYETHCRSQKFNPAGFAR